jgi:ribosome-binding protein aMBF1 (putative translation factor)
MRETADILAEDIAATVEISVEDIKSVQAQVIADRKTLGLSRRQMSVEMGWTESRVWYLEQEGVRLDVERNSLDIRAMIVKLIDLKAAGWVKPSVTKPRVVLGTDTKAVVTQAVAEALTTAREAQGESLNALADLVQELLDEAKAKKAATKPLTRVLEAISEIKWTEQ